jgi:hypothetical protein
MVSSLLYSASCGGLEWALGEAGIPYSYGKQSPVHIASGGTGSLDWALGEAGIPYSHGKQTPVYCQWSWLGLASRRRWGGGGTIRLW